MRVQFCNQTLRTDSLDGAHETSKPNRQDNLSMLPDDQIGLPSLLVFKWENSKSKSLLKQHNLLLS